MSMISVDAALQTRFISAFGLDPGSEKANAVFNTDGPALIIAGPGTGKTYTLVLRTLYLLLSDKAKPSEVVLTTFTEKSAYELRDRLSDFSRKLKVKLDLHELVTGTIHSICDRFNNEYIRHTPIQKNYIVLTDLSRPLFLYENFNDIIEPFKINDKYFGHWKNKWGSFGNGVIEAIQKYYDKITEELIDPDLLESSTDSFLVQLGQSYKAYHAKLREHNRVDFAFQQRVFYDLLQNEQIRSKITAKIKYLLIDEYQDTNYIQEQIALNLVKPHNNITVVGDEDQALYRFRGATVRNILEFKDNFPVCHEYKLLDNYRSHSEIITRYNRFMEQTDWSNKNGPPFRYPGKTVTPASTTISPPYPAVFSIQAANPKNEGRLFADMVEYFLDNKVIDDPSDVALLLRSVQHESSAPYIEALKEKHIKYFCPRAKAYFENEEVLALLTCLALIFGFIDNNEYLTWDHADKITAGLKILAAWQTSPIAAYAAAMHEKIATLTGNESLDVIPSDISYSLFAYDPFKKYLKDENAARNLSQFTNLMNAYMTYYHMNAITAKNKTALKNTLFRSFFYYLLNKGQDEYEDDDNPIPSGYVQIMTIHQSKGLEFPVVVVGSLDKGIRSDKQLDRALSPFYRRRPFEPEDRITGFDHARLFYVAFSRPQKILVLSNSTKINPLFNNFLGSLDQWPHVKRETLNGKKFKSKEPYKPKKTLSLTSHINVYDTCPRQYQFYKYYEFTPSHTGQMLFGSLVHETIEDIHRRILDHEKVDAQTILFDFENNYKGLLAAGQRPLAETAKKSALGQCLDYFDNNADIMSRVQETEVDVSYEKDNYIITGKIDLLLGDDKKLEILDFKSQPKPSKGDPVIQKYTYQLHIYAHILNERYGKLAERLYLYWTAEKDKKDALVEIPFDHSLYEEASAHFDRTAACIINKDWAIKDQPDRTKVCDNCDFMDYCGISRKPSK